MILTVVGSGTLVPTSRRSTPSLALETSGQQLTVDGGTGTLRRQAELGIDFRRTGVLCFTHVHPDHTLDLLHFLFASKYTPGFERTEPIRIVGPPGFETFLRHLRSGYTAWTDGGEAGVEVIELGDRETADLGDIEVTAFEMNHSVTDMGYRFSADGAGTAAFTGDTGWCESLVDLARNVELLVAECSGDAAHPASGHLTAPEVGRVAEAAGVRQLVLTHLYPLPDDRIRIDEVARHYRGPVTLAGDGTRFLV